MDPNSPNVIWMGTDGTIQIREETTSFSDQGYYQCVVTNSFGTAVSVLSFVEMAVLGPFPSGDVKSYFVQEGTPFSLPCGPLKSAPVAEYSWSLARTVYDTTPIPYTPNKRVQIENNRGKRSGC